MKSARIEMLSFPIYFSVANIICRVDFNNRTVFSYFKKRFQILPSATKTTFNISLIESSTEYFFSIPQDGILCRIKKYPSLSLEDLYFILQALIQYKVLDFDIFLLHASSFIKGGKAYLCMAPSGSGKSTIISQIAATNVLSDDVAVLKKMDETFFVFTSAFDNKRFHNFPSKKAPLEKIFSIKQASFTKLIDNDVSEIMGEIMYNNLLFWLLELQKKKQQVVKTDREVKLHTLGLELANSSQIQTLYFTKDLDLSSLI